MPAWGDCEIRLPKIHVLYVLGELSIYVVVGGENDKIEA